VWSALAGHLSPRAGSVRSGHIDPRAVLIVVVGLAYATVLALDVATLLTPPRLSFALEVAAPGHARVAWVLPGSRLWERGVRVGAAVLTIDGRQPLPRDAGFWTGERVVVRGGMGQPLRAAAEIVRPERNTWPLLLLGLWFLLLGTAIVRQETRPAVARATYAFFVSLAFALGLAPAADGDELVAAAAEWVALPLVAACFVLFFLTFPRLRAPRLRAALVPLALMVSALGLVTLRWPALYDVASLVRLAVLLPSLLLGVGLLVFSYATEPERETRRGLAIVCVSAGAAVLPFALLCLLPAALGQPMLLPPESAISALALLGVGFAYAILRHKVLAVRLLQRWLLHGLLWVGLLVPYVAVVFARDWLFGTLPEPGRTLVLATMLTLLVGLTFRWLYDRLRRSLDRWVFKDSSDYRSSLQRLSQDLLLAGHPDTFGATLRRLMNLDFAVLLVHDAPDDHGGRAIGAAGAYQEVLLSPLIDAARVVRDVPQVAPLIDGQVDLTVLLVPLRTPDAVVGHLCLGPKASGEPFRAEDHALLATLSGRLAALVRNAHLVGALRAQVGLLEAQKATLDMLNERLQRAHEEERIHLVADIHDESLQTAIHLRRQLAADERTVTAQHLALSQALVNQLHALCTAVRPPALDELGLAGAIEVLALDLTERAGPDADVSIRLDIDARFAGAPLPSGADIVLYRAAQEGLNNSLRHARPRVIDLTLRRHADVVRLSVVDDGMGFAAPTQMDDLTAAGHLGLVGLQHRVQRIGGRLRVTSTPGQGTVVQVELPVGDVAR